jgi:hypothetical protein
MSSRIVFRDPLQDPYVDQTDTPLPENTVEAAFLSQAQLNTPHKKDNELKRRGYYVMEVKSATPLIYGQRVLLKQTINTGHKEAVSSSLKDGAFKNVHPDEIEYLEYFPPFEEVFSEESYATGLIGDPTNVIKDTHQFELILNMIKQRRSKEEKESTKEHVASLVKYLKEVRQVRDAPLPGDDLNKEMVKKELLPLCPAGSTLEDIHYIFKAATGSGYGIVSPLSEISLGHAFFIGSVLKLNHSCEPNCGYYFSKDELKDASQVRIHIYSLRPIRVGEELTVCYTINLEYMADPFQRSEVLEKSLGFSCKCARCMQEQSTPSDRIGILQLKQSGYPKEAEFFVKCWRQCGKLRLQAANEVDNCRLEDSFKSYESVLNLTPEVLCMALGSNTNPSAWETRKNYIKATRLLWYELSEALRRRGMDDWYKRVAAQNKAFGDPEELNKALGYLSKHQKLLRFRPQEIFAFTLLFFGSAFRDTYNMKATYPLFFAIMTSHIEAFWTAHYAGLSKRGDYIRFKLLRSLYTLFERWCTKQALLLSLKSNKNMLYELRFAAFANSRLQEIEETLASMLKVALANRNIDLSNTEDLASAVSSLSVEDTATNPSLSTRSKTQETDIKN